MAGTFLGRFGQLREDSFFKQEQEADIQDLRQRLLREGKLTEDDILDGFSHRPDSLSDEQISPQLMECLQMSARIHVPDAAKGRVWELRKRAGLPPLSDRDLERAILQLKSGAVANFVPQGMRLSTSHSTSAINRDVRSERYASRYHVTPEQEELARRQFMIGLRVCAYGSMLGILGVAAACTATAQYCDVHSMGDIKAGFKRAAQAWREPLRESLAPLKRGLCAWVGRDPDELDQTTRAISRGEQRPTAAVGEPNEFRRLMKQRFNPPR